MCCLGAILPKRAAYTEQVSSRLSKPRSFRLALVHFCIHDKHRFVRIHINRERESPGMKAAGPAQVLSAGSSGPSMPRRNRLWSLTGKQSIRDRCSWATEPAWFPFRKFPTNLPQTTEEFGWQSPNQETICFGRLRDIRLESQPLAWLSIGRGEAQMDTSSPQPSCAARRSSGLLVSRVVNPEMGRPC